MGSKTATGKLKLLAGYETGKKLLRKSLERFRGVLGETSIRREVGVIHWAESLTKKVCPWKVEIPVGGLGVDRKIPLN